MFKVIHAESKKVCTVYAVRVDDGRTMFLFWDSLDYGWKWEDADDYLLVNEIKLQEW